MTRRKRRRLIVGIVAGQVLLLGFLVVRGLLRVDPDVVTIVRAAARREGVDPDLAEALVRVESKGDPRARSRVGAVGLCQLMPATARDVARREGIALEGGEEALHDPRLNARLGMVYLREMLRRFDHDERLALAAYNAGPGRVQRWLRDHPHLDVETLLRDVAFRETKNHVERVLETRDRLREGR